MGAIPPGTSVSLLWPAGSHGPGAQVVWDPTTIADLDLDSLADALDPPHPLP